MFLRRIGVASVVCLVGCGNEPPPEAPAPKPRPADTTEVKMEAMAVTSAPSSPAVAEAPSAAPAPPAADPAEDPSFGGAQEPAVERAVAPIRPRLRACYKKALEASPGLAGSVTFDTTIGKDGKVSGARFVKKEGLSDDMVSCLTSAVKAMQFGADRKSQVVAFTFGGADAGAPKK